MRETMEDDIVEVSPGGIRLRKRDLDAQTRMARCREEKRSAPAR
jgi:predicted membrane GTPase involved in stress response